MKPTLMGIISAPLGPLPLSGLSYPPGGRISKILSVVGGQNTTLFP